jgi:hypothetical protein
MGRAFSLTPKPLAIIATDATSISYAARSQNGPIVERNSFRLYRSKRNEFRSTIRAPTGQT